MEINVLYNARDKRLKFERQIMIFINDYYPIIILLKMT